MTFVGNVFVEKVTIIDYQCFVPIDSVGLLNSDPAGLCAGRVFRLASGYGVGTVPDFFSRN